LGIAFLALAPQLTDDWYLTKLLILFNKLGYNYNNALTDYKEQIKYDAIETYLNY